MNPKGSACLAFLPRCRRIFVEQLHDIYSALYKNQTDCCKNNSERSTLPKLMVNNEILLALT